MKRELNPKHASLIAVIALLVAPLAGCVDVGDPLAGARPDADEGNAFDTSRGWSVPVTPPAFEMLPGVKTFIESFDGTEIAIGVFRPDVPGCDWEAEALPEACRLPTVMDAGPYYADVVDVDKLRPPTIEWLVPRGYAVVQMAIRGTGESGGCMEFKSMNENRDVHETIDWIARQPWSNGNVGMIGRSYDGTTQWGAAALAHPALKTIVPISGAVNAAGLYFKNGTSEFRGPIQHLVTYWGLYGVSPGSSYRMTHWQDQFCEETVRGARNGPWSTVTGDASSDYWRERDLRAPILENYNGSVWVVQGMHDWNVNPSQAVPFLQEMQDAGIEVRAWLGQWGHNYPDRVDEHRNVRWDWAQLTLEWFDHYLKGEGEKPPLTVEVEDSLFTWREEATYPPRDAEWWDVPLNHGGSAGVLARDAPLTVRSDPVEEPVRVAGLPRFHFTATPSATGPTYAFAELYDVWPDGRTMRIAWGVINLEHASGGNTNREPLVPGQPVLAKMEFEPVDALVAKGHRLMLRVHMDGVEGILASPTPGPVLVDWGASTLSVPVVERPNLLPAYEPPGAASGLPGDP